jgi:putative PIN family toxin of toxin-antitoxin system
MFRIVLDTNVIVSALWSSAGIPVAVLDMALSKEFALFVSKDILDEYEDVLYRDKFRHKFSRESVAKTLTSIKSTATCYTPPKSITPHFVDETDRKFYDLARMTDAYLVTGNIKHFPQEENIITPSDFIKKVW